MLISYPQAILLGLLQGISELFPISSLGHSVILPSLLGWNIKQNDPSFLTFLVATHLATAIVLVGFFKNEWLKLAAGFIQSLKQREIKSSNPEGKIAWLLVVGTIPAGILGLLFEDKLKMLFANPVSTSFFLFINGFVLLSGEILRRKSLKKAKTQDDQLATLSWNQTLGVGLAQAIALIPGFSRTGATITGGLFAGLSHPDSAYFSFLLATPIIAAASLLKLAEYLSEKSLDLGPIGVGMICSGVSAYFSVRFLTRYFRTNTLTIFAIYCLAAGGFSLLYFWLR